MDGSAPITPASTLTWVLASAAVGWAAGRLVVDPGGAPGTALAVALVAALAGAGWCGLGRAGGGGSVGIAGASIASLALGALGSIGPAASAPGPGEPWPLPEDPERAIEALQVRHHLEGLGADETEQRRVLEALVAREVAEREASELEERERLLERERAAAEAEAARRALVEAVELDLTLVRAGRVAALNSGPLADREVWERALSRLAAIQPGRADAAAVTAERRSILNELLESLAARDEGLSGPLSAAIGAIETRAAVLGPGD